MSEPVDATGLSARKPGGMLALVLAGALVLAVAGIWWLRRDSGAPPARTAATTSPASAEALLLAQRSLGDSQAPLIIYEFSDFQCPYCRVFWEETMPLLEREYVRSGKARLIFVNFPIEGLHPNAHAAHQYAMCAAAQNRFWRYHDLLFRYQSGWSALGDPTSFFRALADSARLDQRALTSCLDMGAVREIVAADLRSGDEIGINSTPSFLVGRLLVRGTVPIETWRPVLDSILRDERRGTGDERQEDAR